MLMNPERISPNNSLAYAFVCSILFVPTPSLASDTAPIDFKKGAVISADVFNSLVRRVNSVQRGFQTREDLNGSWLCKTSSSIKNDDTRCEEDGLLFSKEGTLTFNASEETWTYAGSGDTDGVESCGMFASSGSYDVRSNRLILEGSPFGTSQVNIYPLTQVNPTLFRWDGANDSIVECQKRR